MRVDLDAAVIIGDGALECREIVFLIAVIRMLLNDWVVLEDRRQHARLLPDEVLGMLSQKRVNFIMRLAPILVLGRVLAVEVTYGWHVVLLIPPTLIESNFVPVPEANRLCVPAKDPWIQEFEQMLFGTRSELITVV